MGIATVEEAAPVGDEAVCLNGTGNYDKCRVC
jgi:hypothetical protein